MIDDRKRKKYACKKATTLLVESWQTQEIPDKADEYFFQE